MDHQQAHVRAAQEGGRVDAVVAKAAAGADIDDRDGDGGEVIVEGHVRGLACGGVRVGQLAMGCSGVELLLF